MGTVTTALNIIVKAGQAGGVLLALYGVMNFIMAIMDHNGAEQRKAAFQVVSGVAIFFIFSQIGTIDLNFG